VTRFARCVGGGERFAAEDVNLGGTTMLFALLLMAMSERALRPVLVAAAVAGILSGIAKRR
jgi:hypothetical protein